MPTVFVNGQQRQYEKGTTFEKIVAEFQPQYKGTIALVYFNGKMRELNKRLEKDGVITLITQKDPAGHSAYCRTAIMIMVVAANEMAKEMHRPFRIKVEFTLGNAYYCSVLEPPLEPLEVEWPESDDSEEYDEEPAAEQRLAAESAGGNLENKKAGLLHDSLQDNEDAGSLQDDGSNRDGFPDDDPKDMDEDKGDDLDDDLLTDDFIRELNERMQAIIDRNQPIAKKTYPLDDAIALFRHQGMEDKVSLFRFRNSSTVNTYSLDGFYDYFYGYMLPSTGYVKRFHVERYKDGLLLNLPSAENPLELSPFEPQPRLYEQLMLSTAWGELVDIATVGDLNEKICEGNISDMILVQEALQERRIGDIAEQIYNNKAVRFVLVAGPSSSGKTTFAHRLSIQLRSFGMRPHILSMDNWFVNRDKTPIDIDGNYNYDVIEAVDLDQFNDDLNDLLDGEEIDLPTFDFKLGRRQYNGDKLRLGDNDILVIEGIHGLNPLSTRDVPEESKFRIYTSALTSLNVDEHNRITSSDTRLLRRLVRDARTRGKSATQTLNEWKKVRDGEDKYIFPFQNNVDAVFNSVLIYEQAVLKQFAEPLLYSVPKNDPAYYEAKRLLKFLDYFVGVDTASVPANSICREFVGGGCFRV